MVAAMEGSLPLCELLLDCGADINHESKVSPSILCGSSSMLTHQSTD